MEDEERSGRKKKFGDEELEDCCRTQEEFAENLGVTHAVISKRLEAAEHI